MCARARAYTQREGEREGERDRDIT